MAGHKKDIRPPGQADLARAEEALGRAKEERLDAEEKVTGLWGTLRRRWQQVHETNSLAALFQEDYRRTT